MISFVIDNFFHILAAVVVYAGGCYTPRTFDATKAAVLAWLAKKS